MTCFDYKTLLAEHGSPEAVNAFLRNHHHPPQVVVEKPERQRPPLECQYRGDVARLVECESCGGNVMIKVFKCSRFSECSLKAIQGVHLCNPTEE